MNPTQGWSTVPANVLPEIARDHEVTALVSEPTDPQFESRYDFEVREFLPRPLSMYHPIRLLQHTTGLRGELGNADIIHSFITYPYLPAAAIASVGLDIPITATALGTYAVEPLQTFWTKKILASGYRRTQKLFCISEYTENRIVNELGITNTTVLPLGIDLDRFGNGSVNGKEYILSVGAIKERKGQDILVEAFCEIADEYPNLDLKIAGPVHSEQYLDEIVDIISKYGLENRVEFLGNVENREQLAELYKNCTFFALTPRVIDDNFEGFGLVYLEAAAFGKPSVATRSGGVPTAVKHGETGLLATEDDVDDVARALHTVLDQDRRKKLGENAKKYAESLSWRKYAEALNEEWEEPQ